MKHATYTETPGFEAWKPQVWTVLTETKPSRDFGTEVGGDRYIDMEMHPAAIEYCLKEGVVGLGWDIGEFEREFNSFEDYLKLVEQRLGENRSPKIFGELQPGDLFWLAGKASKPLRFTGNRHRKVVQFTETRLYLALAVGPWEYRQTPLSWIVGIGAVAPALIRHVGNIVKGKFETHLPLSDEERGLVEQIWEGYLTKPGTIAPIRKEAIVNLSKKIWAIVVNGSSPVFRDMPSPPPSQTLPD